MAIRRCPVEDPDVHPLTSLGSHRLSPRVDHPQQASIFQIGIPPIVEMSNNCLIFLAHLQIEADSQELIPDGRTDVHTLQILPVHHIRRSPCQLLIHQVIQLGRVHHVKGMKSIIQVCLHRRHTMATIARAHPTPNPEIMHTMTAATTVATGMKLRGSRTPPTRPLLENLLPGHTTLVSPDQARMEVQLMRARHTIKHSLSFPLCTTMGVMILPAKDVEICRGGSQIY